MKTNKEKPILQNVTKIRMYYQDTDMGGIVYYANYLRYMEQGRADLFRSIGINLAEYQKQGYLFPVAEVHVKYKTSARYNDLLSVETTLTSLKGVSLSFETEIYNQEGKLLTTAKTKVGCIDANGRPCRIPDEITYKIRKE